MPDPTPGTPRTEAGRRLVSFIERGFDLQPVGVALETVDALILAIEAEARATTGLDAAWEAAEAALPEFGRLALQRRPENGPYEAWAQDWKNRQALGYALADTPAAALLALAARLAEPPDA